MMWAIHTYCRIDNISQEHALSSTYIKQQVMHMPEQAFISGLNKSDDQPGHRPRLYFL